MKLLYLLLSLLFLAMPGLAQTNDVRANEINKLYVQTTDAIAVAEKEAPYSEIYTVELSVNRTGNAYPAVGTFERLEVLLHVRRP